MPTQIFESPPEQSDIDRMLVRLLLVAELLLNPTPSQLDELNPEDADSEGKSMQKSASSKADV